MMGIHGAAGDGILNSKDTWLLATGKDGKAVSVIEHKLQLAHKTCTRSYRLRNRECSIVECRTLSIVFTADYGSIDNYTSSMHRDRNNLGVVTEGHTIINSPGRRQHPCVVCSCTWCRTICSRCNISVCRKCMDAHKTAVGGL